MFPGTAKRWIHRQASGSESDETTSIPPEATDFHSMVDLITSEKSATVKRIQGLLTKRKKRTESSTTVVEGPRIVFDLLRNPSTRSFVQQVVVSIDRPEWTDELLVIKEQHQNNSDGQYGSDLLICEGTPEVLAKCSDTVSPQGIVATVRIPPTPSRTKAPSVSAASSSTLRSTKNPLYLVCDGVSDPGNIGTLLRSSVAVGVTAVILLPDCCDVWNPKAVRSSMGCCFQVPILQTEAYEDFTDVLSAWGIDHRHVYAATMESSGGGIESARHYDVDWTGAPSALIVGKEGSGLSPGVRHALEAGELQPLHVPMETGIESLNAAVCGSVVLFEYHRQATVKSEREKADGGQGQS